MTIPDILERIADLRVLVVGDICLDRWCWYSPDVAEPSAETGIPRTGVIRTERTPGAAGTVANNLSALGVRTVNLLGVIGEDGFGWELSRALQRRKIACDLVISTSKICTFTYTKLINERTGVEDLPRVDFINTAAMPAEIETQIVEALEGHLEMFDVVLVSDQAETDTGGVITPAVREAICRKASAIPNTVIWADSRRRLESFHDVILKPNQYEAEQVCIRKFGHVDLRRLAKECTADALFVTQGAGGVLVFEHGEEHFVPGRRVEAVDVCGAGDSFSAGAACAFAITRSAVEAAKFGNLVASITVTKRGTGTASPAELLQAALA